MRRFGANEEGTCELAQLLMESIKIPIVVLRGNFFVDVANLAFYKTFQLRPGEVEDKNFFDIWAGVWSAPGLKALVEQFARDRTGTKEFEFEEESVAQGKRTMCIELRTLGSFQPNWILMVIEDITQRKRLEQFSAVEQHQLRKDVEAGISELRKASHMLQNETAEREQVETALHASEYALLRSREELRHLSASLMNAQDAERRRVSRELHDDLSQKVARLQFDIETLEQKVPFDHVQAAKERMRDLVQQVAGLSNDLRRVAHQLHPATLDHLGLSVALRAYTEEFSRSTAIPVKFTSLFVPRELPIQLASGLYRIVQEALRNVGKHASTASVEIVLARAPEGVVLFVRDSGQGFDLGSARKKGGLGLISIEERVRLLEGTVSVETRPGQGVLISIQCPLPENKS